MEFKKIRCTVTYFIFRIITCVTQFLSIIYRYAKETLLQNDYDRLLLEVSISLHSKKNKRVNYSFLHKNMCKLVKLHFCHNIYTLVGKPLNVFMCVVHMRLMKVAI